MDKREVIHALIDKLLEIEQTTKRGIDFEYSSNLGISFNVTSSPKNYTDKIRPIYRDYFADRAPFLSFEKAEFEIGLISLTPDKEPEVSIKLPESRARELGLIL